MIDLLQPARPERGLPPEDLTFIRAYVRQHLYSAPEWRAAYANAMSVIRRNCCGDILDPPTEEAAAVAATLGAEGIADLGVLVDAPRVADMLGHFRGCADVYASHWVGNSDGIARSLEETRRIAHYGCYASSDVVRCPHLIEIANDPRLLQIAEAYIGCPPTLYQINAWWSFAKAGTTAPSAQVLHRDMDDLRFATLFIYLTDVDEKSGAHRYVKYSHDKTKLAAKLSALGWSEGDIRTAADPLFRGEGYEVSALAEALVGPLATVWTGPAGSAVLADTYGLHMGIPLTEGARLMVWVRYGLGIPPEPEFGGGAGKFASVLQPRIPHTARARYINRLLLTD
jgi:hypothetical protein